MRWIFHLLFEIFDKDLKVSEKNFFFLSINFFKIQWVKV